MFHLKVANELKDIEGGFLPKDGLIITLKSLENRCQICIEEFLTSLEILDGLQPAEHQDISKSKKKSVSKDANTHLDTADEILKRIEGKTAK